MRQCLPTPLQPTGRQLRGVKPRRLLSRVGFDQVVHHFALAQRILGRQAEQVIRDELVDLPPHRNVGRIRTFRRDTRLTVMEVPAIVVAAPHQVRAQCSAQRGKAECVPLRRRRRWITQVRDRRNQRRQIAFAESAARQGNRGGEGLRQRRPCARVV